MSAKEKKFWEEFLDLYKSMPCLWKIKSAKYYNRDLKNKSYCKMVEKLKEIDPDANREKVVKKINVFRTNYKRDLKKVKKSEKSDAGSDKIFKSSLWYYDKLQFLEDQECSRERKCTMDVKTLDVESGGETLKDPPSRKRKSTVKDNLLKTARQKLENSDGDAYNLAKGWGIQYGELSKEQQIFTRTIFADILYHACLNKITEKTVEDVHKVLKGDLAQIYTPYLSRASTPHFSDCTSQSLQSSSYSSHNIKQSSISPSLVQTQKNEQYFTKQEVRTSEIQPIQPSISQYVVNFIDE